MYDAQKEEGSSWTVLQPVVPVSHANQSSFGGDSTLTLSSFAQWVLAAVRNLCPSQDFPPEPHKLSLESTNETLASIWALSADKVTKVENEKLT